MKKTKTDSKKEVRLFLTSEEIKKLILRVTAQQFPRLMTTSEKLAECNHADEDACQNCCDHDFDPDEGHTCLNCGKDGTEDVLSQAMDECKDRMKYGK